MGPLNKQKSFRDFKIKRNIITTLIRDSKSQYYKNYFDENSKNAKKTWDGIREILKVSTKNRSLPTKLKDGKNYVTDVKTMASKFNEFYVNIGNMVEKKSLNRSQIFLTKDPVPNSIFLAPVDDRDF